MKTPKPDSESGQSTEPAFTPTDIEDLALLLIYLSAWKEKAYDYDEDKEVEVLRAWKGYDFTVLDKLAEKGFLLDRRGRKSVTITKEGIERAHRIAAKIRL